MQQNLSKNFEKAGFKPQTKALSDFEDDYGLEAIEGEDEAADEDEGEDEDGSGEESGDESGESGDEQSGSEEDD